MKELYFDNVGSLAKRPIISVNVWPILNLIENDQEKKSYKIKYFLILNFLISSKNALYKAFILQFGVKKKIIFFKLFK